MTALFDPGIFWPIFDEFGLLKLATVKKGSAAKDIKIGFRRPGEVVEPGIVTTEYTMEFQTADVTKLAEGDPVTVWENETKVKGEKFIVRETPLPQGDGYFTIALLTKL